MTYRSPRLLAAVMTLLVLGSTLSAPADARRGGSFGSRGSRTYSAPRTTYGSSRTVPPIERSMTPRDATSASPSYTPGYAQQPSYRPAGSRFGGFGGGLIGGLIAGGLIGHFLGHGMGGWGGGGGGGFLIALIQLAIIGGIVWFVIGLFRRRSGVTGQPYARSADYQPSYASGPWGAGPAAPSYAADTTDITITPADQQDFERLLIDVQDAFGREDYGRLRQLTTPEIMSYLSEELSQNATRGLRNEVSGTRLLDAEVSEAWREAAGEYATIVMRYEGIDVMRDRTTGTIASGSAQSPTETTELWTFVRTPGAPWKLSAIQEG